jgi:hypothetical protein
MTNVNDDKWRMWTMTNDECERWQMTNVNDDKWRMWTMTKGTYQVTNFYVKKVKLSSSGNQISPLKPPSSFHLYMFMLILQIPPFIRAPHTSVTHNCTRTCQRKFCFLPYVSNYNLIINGRHMELRIIGYLVHVIESEERKCILSAQHTFWKFFCVVNIPCSWFLLFWPIHVSVIARPVAVVWPYFTVWYLFFFFFLQVLNTSRTFKKS